MCSLCMAHTIKNPHEYKGPRLKTLGREDQQIKNVDPGLYVALHVWLNVGLHARLYVGLIVVLHIGL